MKETKEFETESKELLNLMINSIYTNKDIFLREIISNASDAIDKYRYLSLNGNEKYPQIDHQIDIIIDKKARSLTIKDNGVGMDKKELVSNLGTIAKSGSKDFAKKFKEAKEKQDMNIIGQFGVGFYSAFMVADKVSVLTKKPIRRMPISSRATASKTTRSKTPRKTDAAPRSRSISRRTSRMALTMTSILILIQSRTS